MVFSLVLFSYYTAWVVVSVRPTFSPAFCPIAHFSAPHAILAALHSGIPSHPGLLP